ncbi:MAG: prepilin-type N-terminal cleavage/methylation domain-containing protein [Puniceicoccales bacterium]|jgi:prepilin-type N-terminal cleavage/methylation domain-containing protein|nr:prepilin-type N-terminal cleavage/methylation domain-containing protein [Puniceicoccales bacterium]
MKSIRTIKGKVVEFRKDSFRNVSGYRCRRDSMGEHVSGSNISRTIKERIMKIKKSGFTLIEILMGIAIGGVVIGGMFAAVMAYMRIWQEISGVKNNERFNREIVTRNVLSNELSMLLMGLDKLEGNPSLTFRKLNGAPAIYGDEDVYLYWESTSSLTLLEQDNGGITQCWLKFEGKRSGDKDVPPQELRLYYRSLKPGEKPDFSGSAGDAKQYFTLLKECKGINLGYTDFLTKSPDIQYSSTPKFSNGKDPDLPEVIQILVDDNPVT